MIWFVQVVGPHDCTSVGPFTSEEAAQAWADKQPDRFDYYVMDEDTHQLNVAAYGPIVVEPPEQLRLGESDYAFHR